MGRFFPKGISLHRSFVLLLSAVLFNLNVPAQDLAPGKTLDRSIGAEETHSYSVSMKAGDALRVDLLEKRTNLAVAVKDPAQKIICEYDLGDGQEKEKFTCISEQAGNFTLTVTAQPGQSGDYSLSVNISPANDLDKKTVMANGLSRDGEASYKKGTAEGIMESITMWEKAMAIYAETGDVYWDGMLRGNLGVLYSMLGQKQKALEYQEKALELRRKEGNRKAVASTLTNIATIYAQTNQSQKAVEYFEMALPMVRESGDKAQEAVFSLNLGALYSTIGSFSKSRELGLVALGLADSIPDKRLRGQVIATTYVMIGTSYQATGDYPKALEYAEMGLKLVEGGNDLRSQAALINNMALLYGLMGDRKKAILSFKKAVEVQKLAGDKEGQATTTLNIAEAHLFMGEREEALAAIAEGLVLAKAVGSKRIEATLRQMESSAFGDIGDYDRATELIEEALAVARSAGLKDLEAYGTVTKGKHFRDLAKLDEATETFEAALHLVKLTGNKPLEGSIYTNLAAIAEEQKNYVRAAEYAQAALQLGRELGQPDIENVALNNLAILSAHKKDGSALRLFADAFILGRRIGAMDTETKTISNLSYFNLYPDGGNRRLGIFYAKITINNFQKLRAKITGLDKNAQQTYLKSIEVDYRVLADKLLEQGRLAEAQQVLNLFKDQQYFDFGANSTLSPVAMTEREREAMEVFTTKLNAAADASKRLAEIRAAIGKRAVTAQEKSEIEKFEKSAETARSDFTTFLEGLSKQFSGPLTSKDEPPTVSDLAEMQAAIKKVSAETGNKSAAIYTVVGFDEYRALVITQDRVFAVTTPIQKNDLNKKALDLWNLLRTPKYDPRRASNELYKIVFAPIAAKLPADIKTLVWSLDWNLRYVPMAALYDGRRFLAERYENVNFTRADTSRITVDPSTAMAGTGMGSSEAHTVDLLGDQFKASALPAVKAEMDKIFIGNGDGVLAGGVLLDSAFTRSAMLDMLKVKRPLVHIASHFRFLPGDESRSFLLLGDGKPFTLNDMRQQDKMFAGVDLLTLSACETAAQKANANGREIDGFAELAQRLGAGAVMASLWEVSDDSTAELMARFYRDYRGTSNSTKAAALRRAQLALLTGRYNQPLSTDSRQLEREGATAPSVDKAKLKLYKPSRSAPFSHPYYWSPFVLIGNWK